MLIETIPTGATLLDIIVGDGYPTGKIVNIIGDSSSGKCIKNSYILTENGFEKIDDIIGEIDYGYQGYKTKLTLFSPDDVEADTIYKEKVSHTYKIVTRHGYEIEGSENHLVAVWTPNGLIMKHLKDIRNEDTIIIVRGTNKYGTLKKAPTITDLPDMASNTLMHSLPEYVNNNIAQLMGYFVADGNFADNFLAFSNTKDWFQKRISHIVDTEFNHKVAKNGNLTSVLLVKFFQHLFDHPKKFTARYKFVPKVILQSPKEVQASFLRGLIDCDSNGTFKKDGILIGIEYSTASSELAKQVQLMLLNMGIISSHKIKHGAKVGDTFYDHDYHRIAINANSLLTYFDVIGSDKYSSYIVDFYKKYQGNRMEQSDYDTIPFITDLAHKAIDYVREQVGYTKNGSIKKNINESNRMPKWDMRSMLSGGYNYLQNFVDTFSDFTEFFPDDLSYDFFQKMIEDYYHYDSIRSIERIDEETDVYDFHVPDGHLFWANGMINHNTFVSVEAVYQAKKKFGDKVKVRYNDAESGFNFDTENLYGFDIREDMVQTPTIQDFAVDLGIFADKLKKDEYGIYIVDSFDGLCSDADLAEFEERKDYHEKDKVYNKGTYDMGKQKYSSKLFRTLSQTLQNKNILLIIISQIRDNIGVTFGQKWTVSGGNALKFYSTVRLFLKSKDFFEIEDRKIGYSVEVTGLKTRTKHPFRSANLNILFEYGMDNISSNVDYLFDLKDSFGKVDKAKAKAVTWKEGGADVNGETVRAFLEENGWMEDYSEDNKRFSMKRAMDFISADDEKNNKFAETFGTMDRDSLVKYIENNNLEEKLAEKVRKKWFDVEERIKPDRKRKTL